MSLNSVRVASHDALCQDVEQLVGLDGVEAAFDIRPHKVQKRYSSTALPRRTGRGRRRPLLLRSTGRGRRRPLLLRSVGRERRKHTLLLLASCGSSSSSGGGGGGRSTPTFQLLYERAYFGVDVGQAHDTSTDEMGALTQLVF
jgi:hypothetical protein